MYSQNHNLNYYRFFPSITLKQKPEGNKPPAQQRYKSENSNYADLINASSDKFDRFLNEIDLHNKAKNFIARIRREKQMSYGKYLLARKIQEQKKNQVFKIKLKQSLEKLSQQKQKKKYQIEEKIKQLKQKQEQRSQRIKSQQIKNIVLGRKQNRLKRLKSSHLRLNLSSKFDQKINNMIIKTEPNESQNQNDKPQKLSIDIEHQREKKDKRLIKKIQKKLQQLQNLS